jgi:hypothetical protein
VRTWSLFLREVSEMRRKNLLQINNLILKTTSVFVIMIVMLAGCSTAEEKI